MSEDFAATPQSQPLPPVHVAILRPHGSDSISINHEFSYYQAIMSNHTTVDGRPIICHPLDLVGDEYARARNGLIQMLLDHELSLGYRMEYVFWIDDDVVIPPDALPKLMSHNAPIVSGLYFMRKMPHLPVAYYEVKDPNNKGKFWSLDSFPENALIEIDAAGQGCVLIKREVYDSIPKPYYAWRDAYTDSDGNYNLTEEGVKVVEDRDRPSEDKSMGEDLYFFTKCRLHGYKILLDTGVLCGHVGQHIFDYATFASAQSRYHKLAPSGRLNILILPSPAPKPWDGNTLKTEPLGGSETMAGQLAYYLANRHHHIVYIASAPGVSPNYIDGVHYRPTEMAQMLIQQPWDIVIVSRWTDILPAVAENPQIKSVVFWSHDIMRSWDQIRNVYTNANAFVTISDFHASITYDDSDPNNDEEMLQVIMPNAVDLSLFDGNEDRQPGRLVWTSNPNRGLWNAIRIFRKLRKRWPNLEFHIYGRSSVYGWTSIQDPMHEGPYLPEIDEQNVYVHEPLGKADLARELMKSWAMFYPSTWIETFAISVLESQAAGTPVITNPYGALVDTVQGGILTWNFESAIEQLLDPKEYQRLSLLGRNWARNFSWGTISDRWDDFLQGEVQRYNKWINEDQKKLEGRMKWRGE